LVTWGDHIRKRRYALNLSRAQVGNLIGVTEYAIRNWENHIGTPKQKRLERIVRFLGYDPKIKTKEPYGEKILSYLSLHGKSRAWLASQIGVCYGTIHKWVHNKSIPPKYLLKRLLLVINACPSEKS